MRMSDAEAIMWAVEKDPALRSDFCNLTILDRRPTDERIQATLERALGAFPRLRQRVIGAPLRLVPPEFAEDPTMDLAAHVRAVGVPSPGDQRALLDLCGMLAEQPFDRARPLWEFTVIDGLADGRAALLQKVHHTITDGVGGLRLSLALVDFERDPAPADAPADAEPAGPVRIDTPLGVARRAAADAAARNLDAVRNVAGKVRDTVTHPRDIPIRAQEAARFVGSLQRQALVTDPARSDLMVERSLRRHFETTHCSLPALHDAAARLGGSVNDGFVTVIAAALGRYHLMMGSDVEELRVAMPVNTRQRDDREATNSFTPARVLVPIQPADDLPSLFKEMHSRLEVVKAERALHAAGGIATLFSALPTSVLVAATRSQTRTVDFAASNLRGSPVPLYLAGARIMATYPFGPRTASALNVTTISYCDDLNIGCNIDPAAITDIAGFMRILDDVVREFCTN